MENQQFLYSKDLLKKLSISKPSALASITGSEEYKDLTGEVKFYEFDDVCVVVSLFHNLPNTKTNFFGFHIHENGECSGDFSSAGNHYGEGEHPCHKGDLPPVLSFDGNAFMVVCSNRFKAKGIIGKTVILHLSPDDFTTQPFGNSGKRIGCGIITDYN